MDKPAILSNPEAFVVVPVEGTPEMNSAWALGYYAGFDGVPDTEKLSKAAELVCFKSAHKAMFAACPEPTALADIVAYCAALEARLADAEADRNLLTDVLDTRPAINAGLPESYIRWSQSIYSGDVVRAAFSPRKENGNG